MVNTFQDSKTGELRDECHTDAAGQVPNGGAAVSDEHLLTKDEILALGGGDIYWKVESEDLRALLQAQHEKDMAAFAALRAREMAMLSEGN